MNLPNRLTVARILLAPVFLILLMVDFPCHYLAAGLVFGAAALTDLFDGKIARGRGLVTNLGKFLDPIADKMLTTAAFLGFWRLESWMCRRHADASAGNCGHFGTSDGRKGRCGGGGQALGQGQNRRPVHVDPGHAGGAGVFHLANRHPGGRSFAGDGFYAAGSFRSDPHLGVGGADLVSGFQYVWAGRRYFADGSRGEK